MHVRLGSKVFRYGGDRAARLKTLREHLPGEKVLAVPLGGTSWLGAVGFVNAGLELAQQVCDGDIEQPDEIYVAMGTMGTVAGLALGLALSGNPARVQAVRVTDEHFANPGRLDQLIRKTAALLHRADPDIPAGLERRVRLQYRPEFFGAGYAKSNPETDMAVSIASSELGLALEATYTGKAFRALLHDRQQNEIPTKRLFWNTYNSVPLPVTTRRPEDVSSIPEEFLGYFDDK
jgi:D-cysteine desulfhydrase